MRPLAVGAQLSTAEHFQAQTYLASNPPAPPLLIPNQLPHFQLPLPTNSRLSHSRLPPDASAHLAR